MVLSFAFFSALIDPTGAYETIKQHLEVYTNDYVPEKIYVQTDKPYYTSGDTLWFKLYLVEAVTHLPIAKSKVAYVELFSPDQTLLSEHQLFIERGGAHAEFVIPADAGSGRYLLRAYTNHMRNQGAAYFYEQSIPIWFQNIAEKGKAGSPTEEVVTTQLENDVPEVRFFPEGGDLVHGITSTVGVKTMLSSGQGLPLSGKIINEAGATEALFNTYKFGLGSFTFQPDIRKTYTAVIEFNGIEYSYPIPSIKLEGYVLNIRNQKDNISVLVNTNIANGLDGAFVIGHLRGELFCQVSDDKNSGQLFANIPKQNLLDGVATFTLFARDGEPLCERLVFIESTRDDIDVSISTDRETYGRRQPVKMAVEIKNYLGITDSLSDLSLSVTDESSVDHHPYAENIKTWLLLNSDLRGEVENPNYYFEKPGDRQRTYLLDVLMLTHGWRRFSWQSVLSGHFASDYQAEAGIVFNGTITRESNQRRSLEANVFFSAFEAGIFLDQYATDEQGRFSLGPYFLQDTVDVLIQARKKLSEKEAARAEKKEESGLDGQRYVGIQLDKKTKPDLPALDTPTDQRSAISDTLLDKFLIASQEKKRMDRQYDMRLIELDEVEIRAKRKEQTVFEKIVREKSIYNEPSHRLILDSIPSAAAAQSIFDLIRRLPGVTVSGLFPQQTARIRGTSTISLSSTPAYLIDGLLVDESLIQAYPVANIYFIDVLKGPGTSIFGRNGANGVIAIYTRQGANAPQAVKRPPGIINFRYGGFYKAREFYAPDYSTRKEIHIKPDYRTTLFWAPNLFTSEGKAEVSFYTCDHTGNYRLRVEGITSRGVPVFAEKTFRVK
ncbi:MAG: TonB-dependent receptor plug domain-containing protein [Lewinella sp.]|nr:TonB-dependent receptor plug domain-containing protein [Lewinella sp.]